MLVSWVTPGPMEVLIILMVLGIPAVILLLAVLKSNANCTENEGTRFMQKPMTWLTVAGLFAHVLTSWSRYNFAGGAFGVAAVEAAGSALVYCLVVGAGVFLVTANTPLDGSTKTMLTIWGGLFLRNALESSLP